LDGALNDSKGDKAGASNSTASLFLGKINNPGSPRYFNGLLDDVQVFDTALTHSQIKLLHGSAPSCSDGVLNGHETDTDCGGPRCNKCADTKKCSAATDCLSGTCTNKVCAKGCKHQPVVKDCYKDAAGVEWCKVPGGCFQMGSPKTENCHLSNEEKHQVTLSNRFEIQATDATQGDFTAVMSYSPSSFSACGSSCPVETINWHEAAAYCNALSNAAGLTQCYACSGSLKTVTCNEAPIAKGKAIYTCQGYRLPTDAEWEYAYRAGTTSALHNGSNVSNCLTTDTEVDKIGWYKGNSSAKTHPTGKKLANKWGLFDMAGNVFNWCHEPYQDKLGTSAVSDPLGTGTKPLIRGGSWNGYPRDLRAAYRLYDNTPTVRKTGVGVRCVRTLIP